MRAEDVPDEWLDAAWRAELRRRSPTSSAELHEEYADIERHPELASQRDDLRPIIAAVVPLVRAQVADEIEAAPYPMRYPNGYQQQGIGQARSQAARIARGEQP